jgi:predicted metal-binding membrane protein
LSAPPDSSASRIATERLAARDRLVVAGAAGLIVVLAALYTVFGVGMQMTAVEMTAMARPIGQPMQMGGPLEWTAGYALLIFLMWWVMMVAMMTPSAAPVLLLFTAVKKTGAEAAQAARLSLLFLSGYLLAWGGFSALATALQWALEVWGLSSGPMMTLSSRLIAGGVLAAAGLYQLTPLKQACLEHCKSPAQFLSRHARPGAAGALATGMHHGAYCLGCCWGLMALLFVGGIMNLYWIAGLALYVLAEKLLPGGLWFSRITGWLLVLAGTLVMITS